MNNKKQRVVVLGASPKEDRYSNMAVRLLKDHGHEVIPVHPIAPTIEGLPVVAKLENVDGVVDTITVYISPRFSSTLSDVIAKLNPTRIIFNPGTENPELQTALEAKGIVVETACTLVLLKTDQF